MSSTIRSLTRDTTNSKHRSNNLDEPNSDNNSKNSNEI